MDKKSVFILVGFLVLGTLLRLWHLDKPEGMWNDEYLTWQIASASFPFDFFNAINSNCHAPLHYFYLKAWAALFGNEDFILRLSSVVPGIFAILAMYFAGVEFAKNKKNEKNRELVGLACAGFCTLSSFLIYFSQEVRIYSLTFLLTSLVVLFSLRVYNNQTRQNYILLGVLSVLLMLEHTLGFVFVFFNFIALLVFKIMPGKKKLFAPFLWTMLGAAVLILPILPFLFKTFAKPTYFSQWWAPFTWDKVYFYFTDLFSPVIINITDSPGFFAQIYKDGILNIGFMMFALLPTLICLVCIFRNFIKPKKIHLYIFTVFLTTFLTVLFAAIAGKMVFLTKYSIELYPLLILLVSSGLASFKSRSLKVALATVFVVMSLFFITVSNTSATRLVRDEGHRLPVIAMAEEGLKKNDKILYIYYPKERFNKYLDHDAISLDKYNFPLHVKSDSATLSEAFSSGKRDYKGIFASSKNPKLEDYLNKNIFDGIKKGERLFIVTLKTVSIYDENVFPKILKNEPTYEKIPFLYLVTSYCSNYSLKMARKNLAFEKELEKGGWRIYVFKRV